MSAIYICHSACDNEVAAQVAERLRAQGHHSLFLDFDPQHGIPAGRSWERELYQRLRTCQAVVVLCSNDSMTSDWCFAEITHARALGKRIFPLRIAHCELRSLLLDRQVIDLTTDVEVGYQRLWRGFAQAGLDASDVFQWDGRRPPYPGLMAFQQSDAAIFFGRDEPIVETLDVLNRIRRFGGANLIVCVGASGSGKSSLVRAGVLPRLRRDPESWLVIDAIRPMREPLLELSSALVDAYAQTDTPRDVTAMHALLVDDQSEAANVNALCDVVTDLKRAARRSNATVLLTIDQFEEALDASAGGDMQALLTQLAAAIASASSPLMVLVTLRSDFLPVLQNHALFAAQAFEVVSIPSLGVEQLAQIIEGPARVAGIELESGLVQALMDALGDDGRTWTPTHSGWTHLDTHALRDALGHPRTRAHLQDTSGHPLIRGT